MAGDLTDSTLVLIGHGSTLNGDSAAPTFQHAEELRRRGVFGQVVEGFWKEQPSVAAVLRGAFGRRVFIVPLFVSEGYFTEQVIPRELGLVPTETGEIRRRQQRGHQTLHYCGPVGSHPSMTGVILARAAEVLAENPPADSPPPKPAEISLFIAGHGTGNSESSRRAIERQSELIGSLGRYASTRAVFMEEAPFIREVYALATTRDVMVVPFFISDGLHSIEDIPQMLGESEADVRDRLRRGTPTFPNPTERHGRRVWYARSIGREPLLADVILERVRESIVSGGG